MKITEKLIIKINQLLHGYDDGHRLLAGSIKPDSQSAKALLIMSDLSGQGEDLGDGGYLTGYPLPQLGVYAIARTWLAYEMPRPGCVWTHTLLIDFSDLAAINDLGLLDLFQRPVSKGDISSYRQPILKKTSIPKKCQVSLELETMLILIRAIYDSPKECVFVQRREQISEECISLAVWLQQWPRLRRNFRFCTWAPSDRSRPEERIDLQFVPHKKAYNNKSSTENLGKWINVKAQELKSPLSWEEVVSKDAVSGDPNSPLRHFFWKYGAETEAGRAALRPLVEAWQALEGNSIVDLTAAIKAVDDLNPAITSLSRRVSLEVLRFSTEARPIPVSAVEFLIRNLPVFGDSIAGIETEKAASVIFRHAPEHIWPFFNAKSNIERSIAKAAAKLMQPEEALSGASGNTDLFSAILEGNPKIAASPLVWDAPDPIPGCAADTLSKTTNLDSSILHAMLEAENTDVPKIGISLFGQAAVNAALELYERQNANEQHRARRWLIAGKEQPNYLLAAVAQASVKNLETLAFISTLVSYRYPSVSPAEDEWARALTVARGDLGIRGFSFYAYLLRRALSGNSPDPGQLFHFSFDPVHNGFIRSCPDKDIWSMLESELPEVSWWDNWDRANRIRTGVVEAFVTRDLAPKNFLDLTKEENIFKKLVDIAASSLDGRIYLEKVVVWAQNSKNEDAWRRSKIIKKSLEE